MKKQEWPRYDPHRGYLLCEPCWNQRHWNPAYRDAMGVKHPKTSNCMQGGCACGCTEKFPRKTKPDYSKQMVIDVEPIQIGSVEKHKDE